MGGISKNLLVLYTYETSVEERQLECIGFERPVDKGFKPDTRVELKYDALDSGLWNPPSDLKGS